MFFILSRVWDKETILSPHEESNLRPSDSALRCCATEPQRLHGERGLLRSSFFLCPTLDTRQKSSFFILFVLCFIDIDFEEEYQFSQDILNFHFPVVQADITECATYAVVSRLHLSPEFTITSNGGSFVMPGYPSVSVTIPKKAVTSKTRIPLRLKVQNFPEI